MRPARSLRVAVVGAGHMGRHHVRILAGMEDVDLVAAVDPDAERARPNVEPFGVPLFPSIDDLPGDLDAAVVAVPAVSHREVAVPLLERSISTLVEKPLAGTVADAEAIVSAAEQSGAVLAVGHIERFDPAVAEAARAVPDPRRIECRRVAPWSPRVRDVGVVFDLMIHDLDVCRMLVEGEVTEVTATGRSVVTEREDEVRARLTFANGCVAELMASRAVSETERFLGVRGRNGAVDLAYDRRGDKLTGELTDFLRAVGEHGRPRVTGADGLRAVKLAARILAALESGHTEA